MHAFSEYLAAVAGAESLDALDAIAEDAANSDELTNAEYEAVYAAALSRAQDWAPVN